MYTSNEHIIKIISVTKIRSENMRSYLQPIKSKNNLNLRI